MRAIHISDHWLFKLYAESFVDLKQIIRDTTGIPEVLTRLDAPVSPIDDSLTEYQS